jgi:3-deoxy-7-phosphoheptulonate synthase
MKHQTDDIRILEMKEVSAPAQVHAEFPLTEKASTTVFETREQIHNSLHGKDDRLVIIVGPCSIHDTIAAHEYAKRLLEQRDKWASDLIIVMRVYFEKPRTTVGWKGLINDPNLDNSFEINKGLRLARELLVDLNSMGIPAGTEYLDLISPQYVADLVSWGAIGARTTESQVHRELASGLSCPVGFKNATDGGLQVAVDAIGSSSRPHHFLSVTKEGKSAIFSTAGNEDCHIILRGGGKTTNYDAKSINDACKDLQKAGLKERIMVDCSHANSNKEHKKQLEVGADLCQQISSGENRIFGIMIESHLVEGRQNIVDGKVETYGQSITDACIGWEDTETLLAQFASAVQARRKSAKTAAA